MEARAWTGSSFFNSPKVWPAVDSLERTIVWERALQGPEAMELLSAVPIGTFVCEIYSSAHNKSIHTTEGKHKKCIFARKNGDEENDEQWQ